MNQDFMDPELFADFIIEAKEHLETIEPNLLELEKAPDNLSLLNEIFRPMHSLKGASGFLGLNKMNELAHRAENVLDELRKGSMPVTSEIMDVILAATDALRQMIDNLETTSSEGDVDTSAITEKLDAIMAGEAPTEPKNLSEAQAVIPSNGSLSISAELPEDSSQAEEQSLCERQAGDVEGWIESLAPKASYTLTAFGEGHLRDFIEEAKDNINDLSDGLLALEKNPDEQTELVNDLFRYFHNLKGNSGIIAYQEVNSLTHEAETLLNAVRKDNYPVSTPLVDLLLLVTDILEALIYRIDPASGQVTPFDIQEVLDNLQAAVAGKAIKLPASLMAVVCQPTGKEEAEQIATTSSGNEEDQAVFKRTIETQNDLITEAIAKLRAGDNDTSVPDTLYRSLTTIESACKFMNLEEIQVYAQRTAGIVEQGQKTGIDFSLMADLIDQECAIIHDMAQAAISAMNEVPQTAPTQTPSTATAQRPTSAAPVPSQSDAKQAPSPKAPSEKADTLPSKTPPSEKPQQIVSAKGAASAPQKTEETTSKTSSTIRVDHEKLDHLMNLIGELIINRNRYSMLARQLEENNNLDISVIAQNLTETTYAMARISDDLQDTIMKVRMVPVASVFSRFPRLIRDLSRKSNKDVELIIEGDETELDKSVVEVIGDPLVHLIRNSVDHGIESAEARKAAGKDPKGHVYLRAYYKGNSVAIEIEDDGKGIDPEVIRNVAVKKGIITAEDAKLLDDREALELIFAPGFSSAETITDISGRGVGMDVVRTNIKNLKGSINISSEVGKGSRFTLSLPLTLAIIDALMVNVAEETFAIPLDAVSETTKIESSRLTDVKGRKAVTLRGEVLGIVSLAELLGLPCNMESQELLSVVIIQDNDRNLGLVVDSLLERQEVVIKPLGSYLGDIKGISGATIMGDGSVILILDPHEIYTLATSRGA